MCEKKMIKKPGQARQTQQQAIVDMYMMYLLNYSWTMEIVQYWFCCFNLKFVFLQIKIH